jgi:hypothetical protein
MLRQQLTQDLSDMSGRLVITAGPAALAELIGLADELNLRPNITTDGEIHHLAPVQPPPPIE